MGELKVEKLAGSAAKTKYINHLLRDIAALELMLDRGMIRKITNQDRGRTGILFGR